MDGKEDFSAEELMRFYRAVPRLIDQAFEIRKEAVSHRGFHVGSVAFGIDKSGHSQVFCAANHKPGPGERDRSKGDRCGEDKNIEAAGAEGCYIVGFVVVAPHQSDDHAGLDLGVTVSCGHCRRQFRKDLDSGTGTIRHASRLIFVNAETRQRVELRLDKLLLLCNGC